MQVWAVIYHPAVFTDELYNDCLTYVDAESQTRIRKYYHRADSCRTLIGRLMVRRMLKERRVQVWDMKFTITPEGKPHIATQFTDPPLAYNITHDNNLIAMAFGPGLHKPPAFSIGIDVMKIRVPDRESINSFIETVGDQLTQSEHELLKAEKSEVERLKAFFWMWTLKEAYTKALGLGLGFDFKRIEFNPSTDIVKVDGSVPVGWHFKMFTLKDEEDRYQGVVAEYLGGEVSTEIFPETVNEWLTIHDAVPFAESTMSILRS